MWATVGLMLVSLLHACPEAEGRAQREARKVTAADLAAVVRAIQDEIYDRGYQKEFWGFETAGPRGPAAEFDIYITPELEPVEGGGRVGRVIYKYPPFGEVTRGFGIGPNGTAYLSGNPDAGFPWTQPDTLTIYGDDDQICQEKHDWEKVRLELDLEPTAARILEAAKRQKSRTGFSVWESSHPQPRPGRTK